MSARRSFNRRACCRSPSPDGQGLNPLLRHPGMIIHPPMLYLGFVGLVIPFAYAMAALIASNKTDSWIRAIAAADAGRVVVPQPGPAAGRALGV